MRRGARQKDHLFEKFQNPVIPLSLSSIEFKFRFFQLWVLAEFCSFVNENNLLGITLLKPFRT